jgi:hypothetical protein
MKGKIAILILATVSLFGYAVKSNHLRQGTYMVSGSNTKWDDYHGELSITPQGDNYRLVWKIASGQIQTGVGILYNNILSVGYLDPNTGVWGVGCFRILADGELEGRWTTSSGTSQSFEYLVWKRY